LAQQFLDIAAGRQGHNVDPRAHFSHDLKRVDAD
jgi:hypothetical protein